MTVMVAEVSVWKELDTSLLAEETLPVAWPDTLIGIRKWPVKAARSAGEVNTVVRGAELLVTGAKVLPLVPPSLSVPSYAEALNDSVTEGMVTGTAPVGTLIARFPPVVPVIVPLEDPRFSAENRDWNDPDVTRSTSVKVPIVELKYRRAWSLKVGFDSRFANVAVWVIVAEAVGWADRSCRPSRGRTAGVNPRRRRPTVAKKVRARIVGRSIIGVLDYGGSLSAPGNARKAIRGRSSGSPTWQASSVGEHAVNVWVSPPRGDPRDHPHGGDRHPGLEDGQVDGRRTAINQRFTR